MGETTLARSPWRRWVLPVAAVLGAGPWGALAGAALFWVMGEAVGVTFADPGLFPQFRPLPFLWLLLGFSAGFVAAAYGALRLVQRWPRVLGAALVAWTGLTVAATLSEPSGWDWLYVYLPGLVPAAGIVWLRTRRARA
jgi:hypothetical protein